MPDSRPAEPVLIVAPDAVLGLLAALNGHLPAGSVLQAPETGREIVLWNDRWVGGHGPLSAELRAVSALAFPRRQR
jgi:hypothetical protein